MTRLEKTLYTFSEFMSIFNLKSIATSNIKLNLALNNLGLDTKRYMRDDAYATNSANVNLHPKRGTDWVCFLDKFYFDSYACAQHKKLPNYTEGKHGKCISSEYQMQKMINFCGSLCL